MNRRTVAVVWKTGVCRVLMGSLYLFCGSGSFPSMSNRNDGSMDHGTPAGTNDTIKTIEKFAPFKPKACDCKQSVCVVLTNACRGVGV